MNDSEKARERLLCEVARLGPPILTMDCAEESPRKEPIAHWEGEQRYGLLVETMNEALAFMSANGELAYVNDRFCELLRYSREEVLGRPAKSIYSTADRRIFDEQVARRSLGEAGSYKAELLRRDGTTVPVLISSRPIFDADGCFAGAVALLTDISELRQAEQMLQVQCDLAASLNSVSDLKTAFDLFLETTLQIEGIDGAGIYLVDLRQRQLTLASHRGLSPRFAAAVAHRSLDSLEGRLAMAGHSLTNRPAELSDEVRSLLAEEGIRAVLSIPVIAKEQTIAVLNAASRTRDEFLPLDRRALEAITGRMGGVIIRIQAEESLRESQKSLEKEQKLLKQMLELQERDRKLMAYEIHDGLAQLITGAYYRLQNFESLQGHEPEKARKAFEEGLHLLDRSVKETRNLISGLRPPVLDESGVVPAIEYMILESEGSGGPHVEFHCQMQSERLPGPLESAVFRIVQESLSNARRHSQSDRVQLDLVEEKHWLRIDVQDWGVGFQPRSVEEGHFGLAGIRERARLLGGRAKIDSAPGQGTRVSVRIPLANVAAPDAQDEGLEIRERDLGI